MSYNFFQELYGSNHIIMGGRNPISLAPSDSRTLPFISSPPSKISSDVNVLGDTHAPHLPETPYSFLSSVAVILDPCDHSIGWRFSWSLLVKMLIASKLFSGPSCLPVHMLKVMSFFSFAVGLGWSAQITVCWVFYQQPPILTKKSMLYPRQTQLSSQLTPKRQLPIPYAPWHLIDSWKTGERGIAL